MITSYDKAKDDVLSLYDEFKSTLKGTDYLPQDDCSISFLNKQAERISQDRFCLLIAGETSSGKSTFINAYLGVEILPTDILQCSSSLIEIHYGDEFILNASYADERQEYYKGEENIRNFLHEHASLDDDYRDIPVTTINNEIITKYKDKRISPKQLNSLLESLKEENVK